MRVVRHCGEDCGKRNTRKLRRRPERKIDALSLPLRLLRRQTIWVGRSSGGVTNPRIYVREKKFSEVFFFCPAMAQAKADDSPSPTDQQPS